MQKESEIFWRSVIKGTSLLKYPKISKYSNEIIVVWAQEEKGKLIRLINFTTLKNYVRVNINRPTT